MGVIAEIRGTQHTMDVFTPRTSRGLKLRMKCLNLFQVFLIIDTEFGGWVQAGDKFFIIPDEYLLRNINHHSKRENVVTKLRCRRGGERER